MAKPKVSYEESRRKRLEENKQRMEALNLPKLAQALQNSSPSKTSPIKNVKKPRTIEKQVVAVRRSSRVANKPAPVYKEIVIERLVIPRGISKHRDLSNRVYASDEARTNAIERAEKLLSGLESDYPAFIRSMLPSHVTGGFWLGLNVHFCKTNLPKRDEVMTLIDEDGNEYKTIYLARKPGLSGGWKGFAVAHELVDGDALIFQLIRPSAFKVFILRVNSPKQGNN
ncbi:B3 DNA binding domain containing protein [Parasponia andersonii]|uniref:B3 DNA binding domain containing protein n=1 Tax=Parasponia andersonii TaxID=3476 RepID=A0A2P5ASS8_PARAD|nr:B3 DNA binding domain containing protein [Parasponia andersonii]